MSEIPVDQTRLSQTVVFGEQILSRHGKHLFAPGLEVSAPLKLHRGIPVGDDQSRSAYFAFRTTASELYKVAPTQLGMLGIVATDEIVEFVFEPKTYPVKPPRLLKDHAEWLEGPKLGITVEATDGQWLEAEYYIYYDNEQDEYVSGHYLSYGKLPEIGAAWPLDVEMCVAIEGLLMATPLLPNTLDA